MDGRGDDEPSLIEPAEDEIESAREASRHVNDKMPGTTKPLAPRIPSLLTLDRDRFKVNRRLKL